MTSHVLGRVIFLWVKTGEVNYNLHHATEGHITELGMMSSAARLLPKARSLWLCLVKDPPEGESLFLGIDATSQSGLPRTSYLATGSATNYLYFALANRLRGDVGD